MLRNDEQLIANYLDGDEVTLSFLVDRYIKDVYRFANYLTHDVSLAEDVTQDSFVKAWRHIRCYRKGGNFKTWLFTIARNTAIDRLRKQKEVQLSSFEDAEGRNTFLETVADVEPLPYELLERAEDIAYVASFLEQLNPKYREVLTLRHSSNLTFEEIGELLKRPLHTVKSQHRRALVMLRRLMEVEPA